MALSPAAERQRRRRERLRAGRRCYVVELDDAMLETALIRRLFLRREDADDASKVADALRKMVEQWMAPPPMPD